MQLAIPLRHHRVGTEGSGKIDDHQSLAAGATWPLRLVRVGDNAEAAPGEQDGVQYHFWTVAEFVKRKDAGEFLEWAQVHLDYYGTPISEVMPYREQGIGVLLDIDVQGASRCKHAARTR